MNFLPLNLKFCLSLASLISSLSSTKVNPIIWYQSPRILAAMTETRAQTQENRKLEVIVRELDQFIREYRHQNDQRVEMTEKANEELREMMKDLSEKQIYMANGIAQLTQIVMG